MREQARAAWAIAKKDLAVWVRSPAVIAVTVLPPLVLLLVLVLQAAAVSAEPVALVDGDPGGAAAQALVRTASGFDGFRLRQMSAAGARTAFADLQVAAVLTIPPGFSADLAAGRRPTLIWRVRNFNADSTNDLRRALPDVLTTFLASGAAGPDPIHVAVAERDLHPVQVGLVPFEMVGMLCLLLLQAGIVNAGLAAVGEWQSGSVKELLLSPARPLAVVAGKVVAGVLAADLLGALVTAVVWAAGLLPGLTAGGAGIALAAMTLLALFGSGLGVALAARLRSGDRLNPVSINVSFYSFFLSGGLIALAYMPAWLRAIARFIPNTYATDALRGALLYGSTPAAGGDLLALAVAGAVALAIGIPALRRGLAH